MHATPSPTATSLTRWSREQTLNPGKLNGRHAAAITGSPDASKKAERARRRQQPSTDFARARDITTVMMVEWHHAGVRRRGALVVVWVRDRVVHRCGTARSRHGVQDRQLRRVRPAQTTFIYRERFAAGGSGAGP